MEVKAALRWRAGHDPGRVSRGLFYAISLLERFGTTFRKGGPKPRAARPSRREVSDEYNELSYAGCQPAHEPAKQSVEINHWL